MFETLKNIKFTLQKAANNLNIGGMFKVLASNRTAPSRGTAELIQAYNTMPWLRATASKVGHSVASTGWRAYAVKNRQGKFIRASAIQKATGQRRKDLIRKAANQGELEEIIDNPLLTLLNAGNDFITSVELWRLVSIHIDIVGEAFLLKELGAGNIITGWWPIPPHWVKETPVPGRERFILSINGIETPVQMSEMLWIRDPNPLNPFGRGSGIARALADELETDEFAAKHVKDFFYNNAKPDIIVTADGLQKSDTERLENNWNARNRGAGRHHRTHFLNRKVDIKELTKSFKELQMVELRKFERDTIISVYGVSPEIFGIVESSNRATIDAADYIYGSKVLVPRLELLRAALQERIVPEFDERIILEYDSPVAEDKEFKLDVIKSASYAFKLDEVRDLAGMDALDDGAGDKHAVPFNISLTDLSKNGGEVDITTQPEPAVEPAKAKTWKALNNGDIKILVNEIDKEPFTALLIPTLKATVEEFGQAAMIDGEFRPNTPRIQGFLQTDALEHLDNTVNETTREAIRIELAEAVRLGEARKQVTARIQAVFSDASERRAAMIARTETVKAANFATNEGFRQSGVGNKEWLSSRDTNVRDTGTASHKALDGQVVTVSAPFVDPVSGAEAMHPGAFGVGAEDINCRCIMVPGEASKNGMTETQRKAAWKSFESQRLPFEARAHGAAVKVFNTQLKRVLDRLDVLEG